MDFVVARRKLLEKILVPSGIHDSRLLRVMGAIPRHRFVDEAFAGRAYSDDSLPIGFSQTISKPTVVAQMLQALRLTMTDKVLEVGTGSGYQTAILSRLTRWVFTVDVIEDFVRRAKGILNQLDCHNVRFFSVHDEIGYPPGAPYNAIVVSACMKSIAPSLIAQLDPEGGRLIAPVARGREQRLRLIVRQQGKTTEVDLGGCVFVPFV